MTYTTQQLQAMSDFEVNKSLFKKLGNRCSYQEGTDGGLVFENWSIIDYCNNPNDIMPLAFERNVSIVQSEADRKHGQWCAFLWHTEDEFNDTNPLRAIACLILMMDK